MFTPYGLFVPSRMRFKADLKSSGRIGPAAMTPIPPAFDTAITSGALDDAQLMAAWKIGCSMPRSSVMRVFILFLLDELACLAGELRQRFLEDELLVGSKATPERRIALGGGFDQAGVNLAARLAQREVNAASVLRIRVSHHELALREAGDHSAHLALVDAGGVRKMLERQWLGAGAEERDGPPFPKA